MKYTFWQLLDQYPVRIPIIQRDYAQGRKDPKVNVIRGNFLNAIKEALDDEKALELDFVYGSVDSDSAFMPLDGQQRLTTLFLMHWYFSIVEGKYDEKAAEKLEKFTYRTRTSSKRFCEKLSKFSPEIFADTKIGELIVKQKWFADTWHRDPTVQSMINMLNAIHELFYEDSGAYFDKLTDKSLVTFNFLDLESFGLSDSLYIKMNSRGRPLTDFEIFKARFEKHIESKHSEEMKNRFTKSVDNKWTDVFWQKARKANKDMDSAFLNYFDYIAEVCYYLLDDKTKSALPAGDIKFTVFENEDNLSFLFEALDIWTEIEDTTGYFESYFSKRTYETGKVKLYREDVDLFRSCIFNERFDMAEKLLLYAVVLQLMSKSEKKTELRLLRNLIENSLGNELKTQNLPKLFKIVRSICNDGIDLEKVTTFSTLQIEDEKIKAEFLRNNPEHAEELYQFEDHNLLRGRMSAIRLDTATLTRHREAFKKLFVDEDYNTIGQAVLCFGDYSSYAGGSGDRWQFGNSKMSWKTILTASNTDKIKGCLSQLLDVYPSQSLDDIIKNKLSELENAEKDWDYYFIAYSTMNIGRTGIFVWWGEGHDLRMLDSTRLSGYWRDPYLETLFEQLGYAEKVDKHSPWNIGYDKRPLRVNLIDVEYRPEGWKITLPEINSGYANEYDRLCSKYGVVDGIMVIAPEVDRIKAVLPLMKEFLSH